VRVDGPFDYASWIRGFKAGRSFVTNGPMVTLDVQSRGPGEELELRAGTSTALDVKVSVTSEAPLDKVEVLVNGKAVIARKANGSTRLTLRESIPIQHSSWIAARVEGPWNRFIVNDSGAYAHTSPVYVHVGGEPIAVREDLRYFVHWIEQLIVKVRSQGKFATPERRDTVVKLFGEALEVYRRREAAAGRMGGTAEERHAGPQIRRQ
jgi:hypothetical protein